MKKRLLHVMLLLIPAIAFSADRGPSTPEERQRALRIVQQLEEQPLNINADDREWMLKWLIQVPDISVEICAQKDNPLSKSKKNHASDLFIMPTFAGAA
jgi:hypothetical protein